jgi:hypothetical protein
MTRVMAVPFALLVCLIAPRAMYAACTPGSPSLPVAKSVTEGTKAVTVTATVPSGCKAPLKLWNIGAPAVIGSKADVVKAHGTPVDIASGGDITGSGVFTVTLDSPLIPGNLVVEETFVDATSGTTISPVLYSDASPIGSIGDWGRVKAYFTSGALISQNGQSFSQSNLFLSFYLDKDWKMPGYWDRGKTTEPILAERGLGVNTFFETRLTAIPVTAQPCPATTGSSTTTATSTSCPSSSNASTRSTSNNFNTFLTTQKTARLDVGVYLPILISNWKFQKQPQALFLAPLVKTGVDTPTGSLNQVQAQAQSMSAGNSPGNVTAVNTANFYNWYTFGGRVGHYALTESKNEAPELISYLDIALGRFSNLETILNNGHRQRLYRISLEGLLKVPQTPLVIGLSANVGQTSLSNGTPIQQRAGDDLRFLFGTKFDVGKIVSQVTKIAP